MLYLLLLLLIIMFLFGIMGYYFFGYDEQGDKENWGSLGIAFLSLFTYVTVSRCKVLGLNRQELLDNYMYLRKDMYKHTTNTLHLHCNSCTYILRFSLCCRLMVGPPYRTS